MHYSLTASQIQFLNSDKPNNGFVAGLGAGKSFIATFKTIMMKLKYPNLTVAYYLPNYGLIRDIAFDKFPTMLTEMKVEYELNKSNKEIHIKNAGKIIFRSMDNPETIVGYEVFYTVIDECDILNMDKMTVAYNKIKARNRQKADIPNIIDVVGTPEGHRWFYDRYVERFEPEHDLLIRAKTVDNPYLPEGYIDELRREYPEQLIEAYLEGQFVNLTSGTVYNVFDRTLNDTTMVDDRVSDLHIGLDFNVNHMAAAICLVKDSKVYVIDELTDLFDTPAMIEAIEDKYPGRKIFVYPDAAGNQRKSVNADETDIKLLRQANMTVRANASNPAIMTRVNTVNSMLCNSKGDRKLFVNVSNCRVMTKTFEQLAYDEKTNLPDKASGLDHLADAIGYLINYLFPMRFTRREPLKNNHINTINRIAQYER